MIVSAQTQIDFGQLISEKYKDLTKSEKQIADYLRAQASVAESPGGRQRTMFRRVERGGLDLIFFFSY